LVGTSDPATQIALETGRTFSGRAVGDVPVGADEVEAKALDPEPAQCLSGLV
jgi:hypothetical protein